MLRALTLKVAMTRRKIQIHHRKAQNDQHKIENTQLRGSRAAPRRRTGQTKIDDVHQQHDQRDDVLGIVVPDPPGEPVHPEKAHDRAAHYGNEPDQHARLTHALRSSSEGSRHTTLSSLRLRNSRSWLRKIMLSTKESANAAYARMLSVT